MFHLPWMARLGSATLGWLRTRGVKPARGRPSLEFLSDRILPSVGLPGLTDPDLPSANANAALAQVRIIQEPASAALPLSYESDASSLSLHQLLDFIRTVSPTGGLSAPVATTGSLVIDGQTVRTLDLRFGSSVMVHLGFGGGDAASPGEPGSAAPSSSKLLGGFVDVCSQDGESRFLLDFDRSDRDRLGGPSLSLLLNPGYAAESAADGLSPDRALRDRTSFGDHGPTEAPPAAVSEATSPSLAAFLTDRPSGEQIAGGRAAQTRDEAGGNATGEVAADAPDDPADVLIAVEPGVPDANADLFNLQRADLAVVPTYAVRDAPAAPAAETLADGRPDLSLAAYVVGLDEAPASSRRESTVAVADRVFEQLAPKDDGCEMGACGLRVVSSSSDWPWGAAAPGAVPAHFGLRLREWFDALVPQGGNVSAAVSMVGLEGLLAYLCWRGWRPCRRVPSPKRRPAAPGQTP